MKKYLYFLMISITFLTSCTPKQYLTDKIPIGGWSVAKIKAAEGTSIEVIDATIANDNGWAVITPLTPNAIVKLHPTNSDETYILLARPGKDNCPNWAMGLFPGDLCEIIEKPIRGESR